MRGPGFEPGSQRWQRRILTTILPTHNYKGKLLFLKLVKKIEFKLTYLILS